VGADVVVGFSIGASVALEMVTSGGFDGPLVLLGISLSAKDEPAFFHAMVRLGSLLGSLPATVMARGAALVVKRIPGPPNAKKNCARTSARTSRSTSGTRLLSTRGGFTRMNFARSGCVSLAFRHGSSTPRKAMED
jgi:hypothetical protein